MKKFVSVVLVIALLPIFGIAHSPESPELRTNISPYVNNISQGQFSIRDFDNAVVVIRSVEELEDYADDFFPESELARFDETFFETQFLVNIFGWERSGMFRAELEFVLEREGGEWVDIRVRITPPEENDWTDDILRWGYILEIDNALSDRVFSANIAGNRSIVAPPQPMPSYDCEEISVYLNGERLEFDVPPMIINDRTMVPMRAIFEALGMWVIWNEEYRTIFIPQMRGGIKLQIDNPQMLIVNDVPFCPYCDRPFEYFEYDFERECVCVTADFYIELDLPPTIVDNRTLVPLRAIAEATGATVDWCGDTLAVTITTD